MSGGQVVVIHGKQGFQHEEMMGSRLNQLGGNRAASCAGVLCFQACWGQPPSLRSQFKPDHVCRKGQMVSATPGSWAGRRADSYSQMEKPRRAKNLGQAHLSSGWHHRTKVKWFSAAQPQHHTSLEVPVPICASCSSKLCKNSYPVIFFINILEILFASFLCLVSFPVSHSFLFLGFSHIYWALNELPGDNGVLGANVWHLAG